MAERAAAAHQARTFLLVFTACTQQFVWLIAKTRAKKGVAESTWTAHLVSHRLLH